MTRKTLARCFSRTPRASAMRIATKPPHQSSGLPPAQTPTTFDESPGMSLKWYQTGRSENGQLHHFDE